MKLLQLREFEASVTDKSKFCSLTYSNSYRRYLHLRVALFCDSATASSVTLTTEVINDTSHEDSPFIGD